MKISLVVVLFTLLCSVSIAQIPAGYYDNAKGKSGTALLNALHKIIRGHTKVSYSDLWTYFKTTDKKSNGYVWDMYSDVPGGSPSYNYSYTSDQCGTYSGEGGCYNREHSFPKSWWGGGSDTMYTDLFHIVPTDGYVNSKRSSYPYGEVGTATWTSTNGSKVGTCSYPGYSGTVFEPIDAYKGDFARNYFYMETRYLNKFDSWSSNTDMLDGNGFSSWAENLLLDWNHQDAVSQKEIDRCDAVYSIQNNRNPFIDHPEFVERIWGGVDDYAPLFYDPYPTSDNVASTDFDIVVSLDESCTVYYVVLSDGASAPTSTQVKAGKDAGGTVLASNLKGSISVGAANTNYSDNISGLSLTTAYDVYLVAEDNSSSSNLQSSPTKVDVSTGSSSGGTGGTTYTEGFDVAGDWSSTGSSYGAKTYTISSPSHNDYFSTDNGLSETSYINSGSYSWRLKNTANSYLRYECEGSISSFSIYAARWDNSPSPSVTVRYSIDGGSSYTTAFTFTGSDFSGDKTYKQFSHTFSSPISNNAGSKIYIEFVTTSGERMLYDDFEVNFSGSSSSNSSESNIIINSLWSEPTDIDYSSYSASSGLSSSNSIEVAKFTLQDGGSDNTDADSYSTKLTDLGLSIDKWQNIEALALYQGSTKKGEITSINSSSVTFSSITGGIEAADESSVDFSIYASFKSSVTDNENIKFTISSATADASGSDFVNSNAGGAYTDNSANKNAIEVTATKLSFISNKPPSSVTVDTDFDVEVEAVDNNGNRDLDATATVSLAKASGNGNLVSASSLSKNLSSGLASWTDIQYNTAESFTISASASALTSANSISISASAAASTFSDLIITEYVEGSSNNKYLEIWNNTGASVDLSNYSIDIYANGSTTPNSSSITLSGTLADQAVYIIANNSATIWSGTPDLSSGSLSFNGNDVVVLVNANAKGNVDQLGTIGSSSDFAKDVTLRRNGDVSGPTTSYNSADWTQYSKDNVDGLNNPGPLPIELISFTSKLLNDGVLVKWTTASEVNSDFFLLERSSNGVDFVVIAKIIAAGNSTQLNRYQFIDNKQFDTSVFYRLKQVDYDSKYSYSNIISINKDIKTLRVVNTYIDNNDIFINLVSDKQQDVSVELFDIYGRKVESISYGIYKGKNYLNWKLLYHPKGIYILRISNKYKNDLLNIKLLLNY